MSTAAPTLDDIDASTHNLAHLLDTLVENIMNVSYPANVGDLTRVAALAIIARDMSVATARDFDAVHCSVLAVLSQAKAGRAAA
jgi:hypothetical protein